MRKCILVKYMKKRRNKSFEKGDKCQKISKGFWRLCAKHKRLRCLTTFVLTMMFSLIGACALAGLGFLLKGWPLAATLVNSINNEWYINTFFTHKNLATRKNPAIPDDIIIVDVSDSFSSRKDIANVIKVVPKQKPQIICIDFRFQESASYDTNQNDFLQKTIAEIKDSVNIVFVASKRGAADFNHSYLTKPLGLQFGASDFGGFGEFVPYYDSVPRISLKIAELLGEETCALPNHYITNYRKKNFDSIDVSDSSSLLDLETINSSNIVLIGQSDSPYDIHDAPFSFDKTTNRIPGIKIIAYELSSILAYCNNLRLNEQYPYTFFSWMCNIVLFFGFSILYFSVLVLVNKIKRIMKSHIVKKKDFIRLMLLSADVILSPLVLIVVEIVIVVLCFVITGCCFKIPNIGLLAASLVFVEPAFLKSKYLVLSKITNNEEN